MVLINIATIAMSSDFLQHLWQAFLKLGYGAVVAGAVFGFLLQRARVVRFDKQVNLLLLRDMTVLKFLLSAAVVGMISLYALAAIDFVEIPFRPVVLGRIIVGGIVFGIGWAILGYCPGTQLGALGEGRYDAIAGIIGAVLATWFFVIKLNPWLTNYVMKLWNVGPLPLDTRLGVNPWLIIGVFTVLCILLFVWLERRKL